MKIKLLTTMAVGLLVAPILANAGLLTTDFNSGVPAGTSVSGNAVVIDGKLKLTNAINAQQGFFFINDLDSGVAVNSFTASFSAYVGGGTCCTLPSTTGDGFSFNFASDLPASFQGEEGGGTGLTISFDSWDNLPPDAAPVIDVMWGGVNIGRVSTQVSQGLNAPVNFWDVYINLDSDGTLDLSYNGAAIYTNFATGFTPISGGKFAFGARTGGANDNHWIDDLTIETRVSTGVPVPATCALFGLGLLGLGWSRRKKA